ncbi:MAG TPA: response regulator [Kofleriaceae bacterium]|nr:response regulator [Kofleriaceae bacterium]
MATEQHVLIIEDDRVTALVISEYLAAHGYRTTIATNGQDGVDSFEADRPDLVLCDALLPRVNGFDACTAMRNTLFGGVVPIVMMSAFYRSHRQAMDQVPELDVDGFLVKPFDLDILLDRVAALLPR